MRGNKNYSTSKIIKWKINCFKNYKCIVDIRKHVEPHKQISKAKLC